MENLHELPVPALITFGATLAVIFAVRFLGLKIGEGSAAQPRGKAEVAAMIVDATELRKATAAMDGLSAVVGSLVEVIDEGVKIQNRMHIELDRIREELRIQRELHRR